MANSTLPIRITPHALLSALVAVGYTPSQNAEAAGAAFRDALLVAGFTDESQLAETLAGAGPSGGSLFRGQQVSLQIQDKVLIFNSAKAGEDESSSPNAAEPPDIYLGWKQYFPVICQVLGLLQATGQVAGFSSVAVRYINALPNLPLNDQLRVKLPPLGVLPSPASTFYRATFADVMGFEVVLSLADGQRVAGRTGPQSVFDITVRTAIAGLDTAALFRRIDEAHTCEKQVFFDLLDPVYLASLRPEYA